MFHLSDIRNYQRCKRYFYLINKEYHRPRVLHRLRNDIPVIDLLKEKFSIDKLFMGMPNDPSSLFLKAIDDYEWFYNARLEINNLRLKLPLLHQIKEKTFDVYYPVMVPNPLPYEALYYSQPIKFLQDLGFEIAEIYLVHLNPDYIQGDKTNVDDLLVISKHFYNDDHDPVERVSWWLNKRTNDYTSILEKMEDLLDGDLPDFSENERCVRRPKCEFYNFCYQSYTNEKKTDNFTHVDYAVEFAKEDEGLFIDRLGISNWLKTKFIYPLSFVDFEWDTFSVPPYKNMKPLDVVPFQYSLDIKEEDGSTTHYDFLESGDTRLSFIKSLIKQLPKKGSIVVFNAEGGEKLRLLELQRQFPKYEKEIDAIIERIVDISLPFNNGRVYNSDMNKSYSLKSIVKAIDGKGYDDMSVAEAQEAVLKWRSFEKSENPSIKEELLSYCRKDTTSLITIYDYLKDLCQI